jgi:hypothetical protein
MFAAVAMGIAGSIWVRSWLKATPTDTYFVIDSDHILVPLLEREGPKEGVTK